VIRINLLKDTERAGPPDEKTKPEHQNDAGNSSCSCLCSCCAQAEERDTIIICRNIPKPVVVQEEVIEEAGPPGVFLNVVEETVQDIWKPKCL